MPDAVFFARPSGSDEPYQLVLFFKAPFGARTVYASVLKAIERAPRLDHLRLENIRATSDVLDLPLNMALDGGPQSGAWVWTNSASIPNAQGYQSEVAIWTLPSRVAELAKSRHLESARINVNQEHELRYWAERLGVSREELLDAVRKAGSNTEFVQKSLKRPRGAIRRKPPQE
ncbi:DUF3606 domain-containing protein [Ideonella sp. BN130291]|uniref:DUF3606 domain-containing protein n=1 Tax=Ideonella sp. BN130291 TaxID=3112940 RepID=UPI002E262F2F|nr:DUF3606 domain-containing protein [Ideonella sp. BN130291]